MSSVSCLADFLALPFIRSDLTTDRRGNLVRLETRRLPDGQPYTLAFPTPRMPRGATAPANDSSRSSTHRGGH